MCATDRVRPDRGVAALVGDDMVALFRVGGDQEQWFAIDHLDPVTGAPVMARGLVGSTDGADAEGGDAPTVASPIYKERYDLRTGMGIGNDHAAKTWDVRVVDGMVEVRNA